MRKKKNGRGWRVRLPRLRWPALLVPYKRHILIGLGVTGIVMLGAVIYLYVSYGRIIDARLHGERARAVPRIFARPLTLQTGQNMSQRELIARLNDVGYAQRSRVERAGDFAIDRSSVVLLSRSGEQAGKIVTVSFPEAPAPKKKSAKPPPLPPQRIVKIQSQSKTLERVTLDAPLLTAMMTGSREKRRRVALETIPPRMQEAVLAIEDRRFYYHPGVDPIRMVGAMFTNMFGNRPYLVGGSTITQQLARNFFLTEQMQIEQQTRQRSYGRKILEQFMSVILETKATKDEILELYLNDVYLGNRGSFALHGVAEAAKIYFAKDVRNLTLSEAALIAGIIQSPFNHSPFNNPDKARDRRNVVLRAMVDAGYITADAAERAQQEPIAVVARAVDNEAPYFVDYVGDALDTAFPGAVSRPGVLDIYTTLDLNLQRYAQEAVNTGIANVDTILSRRKRGPKRVAQAALVAVDPRTGEILAYIGGRSYNQSQFNRAASARRQVGSTFKPFVYLAAFEKAADEGSSDITPATIVYDEPTTWSYDNQEWTPKNYDGEYDGAITLRRALAMSRNVAAVKVAEQTGYDRVVALWKKAKLGISDQVKPYPSVALGVVELTPLEVAEAYTAFPNHGTLKKLRSIINVTTGEDVAKPKVEAGPSIARPSTAFLVTHMMRSVLNEGTGASARANGFAADAAGKSGTTNDLRDAWFVGFTPELLTVVWVGLDDNQPLGLSGAQAALPIWTSFMKNALQGRTGSTFEAPEGVSLVEIDRDTGKLATPICPRLTTEAFLPGTEPVAQCELHKVQ
ncbi:MAG: PBP1A family penicillin-binding protein [Cyanobacteria bacterium]|nr:PBP1A family penicillin-binding protein [Cyanobacteriota bacterium]